MASKSLGTLTLDLVAKTGGFTQGMSKAERSSEKWRRKVKKDLTDVGKAMGVALAAGAVAAATGVAVMVSRSREAIDVQAKMAQRLNTTSESLAVLKRATDRTGLSMRVIETAARTLDINLGKASQGMKAQSDAVAKLGLNIEEVAKLPLDERINVINKALRDNVPAYERSAIAADLFGSRGAAAIQQLDPKTIALAAEEARVFGLALSDIDAAKVENANDSFSRIGASVDGLGQQMTIAIAPVLEALGDAFYDYAKDAGGANELVTDSFDSVVSAIAFVANAADGIGRVFEVTADIVIMAISGLAAGVAENIADLLQLISVAPGIDFSEAEKSVRQFSAVQQGVFAEAGKNIADTLEDQLSGDKLIAAYEAAKKTSQAAAESAVANREAANDYNGAIVTTVEELEKVVVVAKKIERSLALQQQLAALDAYNGLVKSLRTEEEILNDTLREQLSIVEAVSALSDDKKADAYSRISAGAFQDSPDFAGLAPEVGGAFGELKKIEGARAELEDWYSEQLDMLSTYRQDHADLNAQWDEQEAELREEHAERLADIDSARQQASIVAAEDLFGNLADVTRQFAGESSDIYKAMFAVEKGIGIARAIVAIQVGIAEAAANPWPANLAAMASVAAATASIVSTISSVSIAGQAHDGLDSVPSTGTYLLKKGERVTTSETSAKLDKTLDDVNQGGGMGGGNIRIVNAYDNDHIEGFMGSSAGEKVIMNTVRRNQRAIRAMSA